MKNIKKILVIGLVFLMCSSLFYGCGGNEQVGYNAKIINVFLKKSFLENNSVSGMYEYDENLETTETLPKNRTFVITTVIQAEEILERNPEIDFAQKDLIIYIYSSYNEIKHSLKQISFANGDLKIDVLVTCRSRSEEPKPIQKYLAIELDKIEFHNVCVKHYQKNISY